MQRVQQGRNGLEDEDGLEENGRPYSTAADFAAIAVAPLLIFLMLMGLAGFLVTLFYDGRFPQRLMWTLAMYTMGVVCIARISIERDRGYSAVYAVALAAATFLTLWRYVGEPILSGVILAVVGILADRLVYDCTLIDDAVDSSGQGLIDRVPWPGRDRSETPLAATQPGMSKPRAAVGHQPGRTVLYLAVAALPLFGIGQFFLGGDPASWIQAKGALAIYLFASLSLLVVTAFLNLRRYLRRRHVEMGTQTTLAWLAGGIGLIAIVLLLAFLAPMPGRTLASLQLPSALTNRGADDLEASRWGWGDEAAENTSPDDATVGDPDEPANGDSQTATQTSKPTSSGGSEENRQNGSSGGSRNDGGEGEGEGEGNSKQGNSQPSDQSSNTQSSNSRSDDRQQRTGKSAASEPTSQSQNESAKKARGEAGEETAKANSSSQDGQQSNHSEQSSSTQQSPDEQSSGDESSAEQSSGDQSSGDQSSGDQSSGEQSDAGSSDSGAPTAQAEDSAGSWSSQAATFLSSGFRWLLFAALLATCLFFVIRYRDSILRWWRDLWPQTRMLEEPVAEDNPSISQSTSTPRPFSSFRNPVGQADPATVVIETFQALEAWCTERGVQRREDETPTEFVRRVAAKFPVVRQPAAHLVDAYNRVVYGQGNAGAPDVAAASTLWSSLRR